MSSYFRLYQATCLVSYWMVQSITTLVVLFERCQIEGMCRDLFWGLRGRDSSCQVWIWRWVVIYFIFYFSLLISSRQVGTRTLPFELSSSLLFAFFKLSRILPSFSTSELSTFIQPFNSLTRSTANCTLNSLALIFLIYFRVRSNSLYFSLSFFSSSGSHGPLGYFFFATCFYSSFAIFLSISSLSLRIYTEDCLEICFRCLRQFFLRCKKGVLLLDTVVEDGLVVLEGGLGLRLLLEFVDVVVVLVERFLQVGFWLWLHYKYNMPGSQILVLVLSLLSFTLCDTLTLTQQPSILSISPHDELTLSLISQQPFIYIQMQSCAIPTLRLHRSASNNTTISPLEVLSPISYVYPINDTLDITLSTPRTQSTTYVKLLSMDSPQKQLPRNSWKITTQVDDQYLKVSFRSIHIVEKEVEAQYYVWFSMVTPDINCRMMQSDVGEGEMGVVEFNHTGKDSETLEIWIPVNTIYPQKTSYNVTYINKSEIIQLINKNENFAVNILATTTSPTQLTMIYNPAVVEHRMSLMDLEGGLMILLVGIVVFGLVSVLYLYLKRKFKEEDQFMQEEIEVEVEEEVGKNEKEKGTEEKMMH